MHGYKHLTWLDRLKIEKMLGQKKKVKETANALRVSQSTIIALNKLEKSCGKYFSRIFHSITVDNGSEFSNSFGIESSINGGIRTKTYYCHPYSSWERGSNEKQNQMLRRKLPKGTNFDKVSNKAVQQAVYWLNNYPRKLLNWETSQQAFDRELAKLGISLPRLNL